MVKKKDCEENAKRIQASPVIERVRLSDRDVTIQFNDVGNRANVVAAKLFGGAGARNDAIMNTCIVELEQFSAMMPITFLRRFHDRLLSDYKTNRPQHYDKLLMLIRGGMQY